MQENKSRLKKTSEAEARRQGNNDEINCHWRIWRREGAARSQPGTRLERSRCYGRTRNPAELLLMVRIAHRIAPT